MRASSWVRRRRSAGARARCTGSRRPGRAALERWLAIDEAGFELRDEGLPKLFFADALGSGETVRRRMAAKRAHHEAVLGELLAIEAAKGGALPPGRDRPWRTGSGCTHGPWSGAG